MTTAVMWFRRDLRLADNLALAEACRFADEVVPLFVLDDRFTNTSANARLAFLYACLRELDASVGNKLVVRHGHSADVVRRVAEEADAAAVFCTGDFGPEGRERDDEVAKVLDERDVEFHSVDSPYAVEPGSIVKSDGTPFKVFTPFSAAWEGHGWAPPRSAPRKATYVDLKSDGIPDAPALDVRLPKAGEKAARRRLDSFVEDDLNQYDALRDQPGEDRTSRMSAYLKFGCIHPRQILDRLHGGSGQRRYKLELCWREFYADVLFHQPQSLHTSLRKEMSSMKVDEGKSADETFKAWSQGQTGYPIVDAGMRQLLAEGFMHNRVRMIVASFLIKDLHIDWQRGARWFMEHLVDGDIASNTHNWQWVAGTGTDPAPYFRIFNPVTQSKKFDPDGVYIRRWVKELREVDKKLVHEPWKAPLETNGYPPPIVEHDEERREALRRYDAVKAAK